MWRRKEGRVVLRSDDVACLETLRLVSVLSLSPLMTNSAQLTVLLVITRLELPSNAVSPALRTITETPALYSHCTVQGGGENIINIGAMHTSPPSYIPSTSGRSHDIVFLYNPLLFSPVIRSAQVDLQISSCALSQSERAGRVTTECFSLAAWCNLV